MYNSLKLSVSAHKLCVALECVDEIKNLFTNIEYNSSTVYFAVQRHYQLKSVHHCGIICLRF